MNLEKVVLNKGKLVQKMYRSADSGLMGSNSIEPFSANFYRRVYAEHEPRGCCGCRVMKQGYVVWTVPTQVQSTFPIEIWMESGGRGVDNITVNMASGLNLAGK